MAMAALAPRYDDETGADVCAGYLETLALIERLHRLLLDVIKDEFERLGQVEITPVQALLLFNIGSKTMTAGELRSRGYYQGSNVSYNLKRLVENGYMHQARCVADRRAVRVRLTAKGMEVHRAVADLFERHADELCQGAGLQVNGFAGLNSDLRALERYWTEETRSVY